eukprot:TRINITY_DN50347_c0_g1_i1.p1 TRINITY_DN50347_c0_g1~~TRINITY_DN50347_c0_g1_i1.p1  ORF type:complete len:796 (+),score=125.18 TRINITY_DN50347_c0_g1_i1:129-2390(+)
MAHIHVAATLCVDEKQEGEFMADPWCLNGLDCDLHFFSSFQQVAHVWNEGHTMKLKLKHFPPGSILVFSTDPVEEVCRNAEVSQLLRSETLRPILGSLKFHELNYLLFSCEREEQDRSDGGRGAYDVPGIGPLVYCGLMGPCAALDAARCTMTEEQFLQSAIVENVHQGDWLINYLVARLRECPQLEDVQTWLRRVASLIAGCPRWLAPFYFDLLVSALCSASVETMLESSSNFIRHYSHGEQSTLVRDLALACCQFWGATKQAPLNWDLAQRDGWQAHPSLCAGLPHFSAGFMRNWGRDTFISLKGCLLVSDRFEEARSTLLTYASVVRHGLCPNLLDAAIRPRYNARDATWFFLQSIQDYVSESDEGLKFLSVPIVLKWPVSCWDEDLQELEPKTIADLIHLILACHAKGIEFREWGAGTGPDAGEGIDDHMTDKGFDVRVALDEDTGIIYGGSEWNCGTWMDKMGSSEKAGNKGHPATPRDGAAVEIIGLLKSTLRWILSLKMSVFGYKGVKTASGKDLSYAEWNDKLQSNFERHFWIDPDERSDALVTGIYKDTVGATHKWQDFQLRPNFCIAMTVAPELFTPSRAHQAINHAAERLIGPLGMCTLDPCDTEYHGDYHNDDDSCDKAIAHGWNYHQGPEWVWPLGFFLEAWQRFGAGGPKGTPAASSKVTATKKTKGGPQKRALQSRRAMQWLLHHRLMLKESPWRSLPELTNSKGLVCEHSCPAQAWSLATILSALRTIELDTASCAK